MGGVEQLQGSLVTYHPMLVIDGGDFTECGPVEQADGLWFDDADDECQQQKFSEVGQLLLPRWGIRHEVGHDGCNGTNEYG